MGINDRDEVGQTALFEAVSDDAIERIQELLTEGADPNISDNNGTTPLMEAASGGSVPIIELLLRYGARWDLLDNFGDSAVDYARNQKHKAAARFLEGLGLTRRSEFGPRDSP